MKSIDLYTAIRAVDDDILERSEHAACKHKKKSGWLKWGVMAACFGLILTAALTTLPGVLKGPDKIEPPPNPGPAVSDNEHQSNSEPLQPPGERKITINWDNVAVNESAGLAPDYSRLYPDPALYEEEIWGQEEIKDYYGKELNVPYIPNGLTGGRQAVTATIYRDKATRKVIEDQVGRGFWADFWEDGSPKSDDDIVSPKGFTITVSKLGIFHCGLLPVNEERTTDFGGVPVTLSHCSMTHGPFDPTQRVPDSLSNMPAGYYDIYAASFTLDGAEYEIVAQRLELEEVIKITASIINMPYSEDFAVGCFQDIPDKGSAPAEYPDTAIVPGFDLDEPNEPAP